VKRSRTLARIIDEIEGSEYYHKYWKERPDVTERTYSSSIADPPPRLPRISNWRPSPYTPRATFGSPTFAQRPLANIVRSRDTIPSCTGWPVLGRVPTVWGLGQGRRWRVEQAERELCTHDMAKPG